MNLTAQQAANIERFTNAVTVSWAPLPDNPEKPDIQPGSAYGFVVQIDGQTYGATTLTNDRQPTRQALVEGICMLYESLREEGVIKP